MKEVLLSTNTFAIVMMILLCTISYVRNKNDKDE